MAHILTRCRFTVQCPHTLVGLSWYYRTVRIGLRIGGSSAKRAIGDAFGIETGRVVNYSQGMYLQSFLG